VDGPGKESWPLAAYTYLILHTQTMKDFTTANKTLSFIQWGITSSVGQQRVVCLLLLLLFTFVSLFFIFC